MAYSSTPDSFYGYEIGEPRFKTGLSDDDDDVSLAAMKTHRIRRCYDFG